MTGEIIILMNIKKYSKLSEISDFLLIFGYSKKTDSFNSI
jgi:hypothetical protein